ncbi:MAG TPA: ATP-binding protein [Solirubrobacteraceae bacterium]|jgi:signal transduction histidine kinase
MNHPTVEDLARVDLFAELDSEQLRAWAGAAELSEAHPGEIVSVQGEPSSALILLLEGTMEGLISDSGREERINDQIAPTWIGAIPTMLEGENVISLRASTKVRLAVVPAKEFVELALTHRSVFRRVMAQVRPVIGRITQREQNRERLTSLGTMAAGLAHELNNPASAAQRSAAQLSEALEVLSSTIGVFVESGLERSDAAKLVALQREALAAAADRSPLDTLDEADAEDELADVLAELGVGDSWMLSEPLASAGVDRDFVARTRESAGPALGDTLRWIAASLSARKLAAELAASTERMSQLVRAIKAYAYMDRGEVVQVDLREGLDTTLTILGHKLKHTQIKVNRDYDPALPRLTVHGAELNQVWTNLLDNAIAALGDSGELTIVTRKDGDCAEVDIADDGPGIPPEIADRVFEPFFTTKDVGQGTGLGLDTARRILVDRHGGSLTLESRPGRTVFRARLPINAASR